MVGNIDSFDGQQNLEEWIGMVERTAASRDGARTIQSRRHCSDYAVRPANISSNSGTKSGSMLTVTRIAPRAISIIAPTGRGLQYRPEVPVHGTVIDK